MKYYLYDEKTKQFVKEQEGYLDPLESEAQGNNVYIVPPFSLYLFYAGRRAVPHE